VNEGRGLHAIVVADGDSPDRAALDAAWPGWASEVGIVVAADGGARAAERLGLRLDAVVGDLDSLGDEAAGVLEARGVDVRRAPAAKDETDAELAVLEAVARGATRLTVVGSLGGRRLDHELANVALLAHPSLHDRPAAILDARARVTLLRAPGPDGSAVERRLPGPSGAIVSLVPYAEAAEGVTTGGLRYPLVDEDLALGSPRGVSNIRVGPIASVTLRRGRLLLIEVAVTLDR